MKMLRHAFPRDTASAPGTAVREEARPGYGRVDA